ncbi:MAG: bacteriophage abortive infection AbiH family protein [bacterium]|nr:bacteriophage abortive infection AbiH family protein [bacterium]
MNILILGNGFDLAHGLKTKYSDFLNYCCNQFHKFPTYKPTDKYYNNLWIRHFINVQQKMGDTWIDLEKEIFKVIQHISQLPIINSSNYQRIFNMNYDDGIFNFYNFTKYLIEPMGSTSAEKGYLKCDPYNEIQLKLYFKTPRGVVNFLYDQLREFTKLFENYLINEVLNHIESESKYKLSLKSIGVTEGSKDVHILNFNYTDTCERFYKAKFSGYCDINIKPVYVHGKVENNNNECNLILGTQSFDKLPPYTMPMDFNVFKKHNQRHKYGTIEPYQDLLRRIKKSKSMPVFHVIGHSLDNTDENILKHILLINSNSKINIYYHNEETQERLMNKINDIIGEEEVMEKVMFTYQHDPKRGILIPQEELTFTTNS